MAEMPNGLLSPRMKEMMGEGEMDRSCPVATRDVTLNLKNRGKAIKLADYGPMNPDEPNREYWAKLAAKWDVPAEEAMTMRCGNCAAFIKTAKMLKCIEEGLAGGDPEDAMDVVEAGDLGYCEIFDFKCASDRTCSAWIKGGPVTDDENEGEYEENEGEMYSSEDGEMD
jgi:hypothetical protein